MKLSFASICLSLATPALLLAELGQNELKVSETYGPAVGEQKKSDALVTRQYSFNGLSVSVTFLNGTSQCEVFKKADGAPLTEEQIEKILEANSNRLDWNAQTSTAPNAREWVIAGPKPSASEKSDDPMVFAVSGRKPATMGQGGGAGKMIAVDMLDTDKDSSSNPMAPPVLRRAIYTREGTNASLQVFTAAYENVSRQERRESKQSPDCRTTP